MLVEGFNYSIVDNKSQLTFAQDDNHLDYIPGIIYLTINFVHTRFGLDISRSWCTCIDGSLL